MKFMPTIHQSPATGDLHSLPEDEQKAIHGEWMAISETPGVSPGLPLQPPEEGIGGYLLFETADPDAARAPASRIPAARQGGAIVGPVVGCSTWLTICS